MEISEIQQQDKDSDYDSDTTVCYSTDDLPSMPGWNSDDCLPNIDPNARSTEDSDNTEIYDNSSRDSHDSNKGGYWLRRKSKDKSTTCFCAEKHDSMKKETIEPDTENAHLNGGSNKCTHKLRNDIKTSIITSKIKNDIKSDSSLLCDLENGLNKYHKVVENSTDASVEVNVNKSDSNSPQSDSDKWPGKLSTDNEEPTNTSDVEKYDELPKISFNKNENNDSDGSDGDMKYSSLFRSILDSYTWNKDTEPESASSEDSDDCGNEVLDNALKVMLAGPSQEQAKNGVGKKAGRKRKASNIPPKPAKRRRRMDSYGDMYSDGSGSQSDTGMLDEISKILSGSATEKSDGRTTNKVKIPNALEEDEDEYGVAEVYDDYMPLKLKMGKPHPDPVVETASLASVEPTDVTYQLQLPQETVLEGKLSALQLEAVVYSAQAHEQTLPGGARAGFLIGDGAGVGKGRTVAGVIFENWLRGRRRAVWLSVSNDLRLDAERDLADIGAAHIKVHLLKDYKYIKLSEVEEVSEGVMFLTYTALSSKGRASKDTYNLRIDQLLEWCGEDFDGVIVLDECHRAKNLCPPGGKGKPTKTGLNVFKLQDKLPKARLVYASATGATEPKNMAYMVRLGLWGEGTAFAAFSDFIKVVEKGGVGAMEIVAMDMKLRGMYIARQLSFRGVTFHIEEVPLTDATVKAYDDAVALWVKAKEMFKQAVSLYFTVEPEDPRLRKNVWCQFWGAHQRFFKYLCIAVKVDRAVAIADEAVRGQQCAVIGLQSTGEASTLRQLEQHADELTELLSTAEGVFKNLVETQMPGTKKRVRNTAVAQRLQRIQSSLLKDIDQLGKSLPRNMLDELIDKLGGVDKVAEMTGRHGRLVRTEHGVEYQSRSLGEAASLDSLNVAEKNRFMGGSKLVAVISEAASSGVSLQSDRRAANGRRRVHVTLELPWSADRAIQQFGRTHRSNQLTAPQYVFLISALAGERRFASVVAKRLESLGALTHGDRRAASDVRDLSHFNVDNKYGKEALCAVLHAVRGGPQRVPAPAQPADFLARARAALEDVGLIDPEDGGYVLTKVLGTTETCSMTKFLNRILGVPVHLQNTLFKYFVDNLTKVTEEAKRLGTFDQGIVDVRGARCVRTVRVLRAHATGHAPVLLHTVRVDRGMDWDTAYRKYEDASGAFYLSKTSCGGRRNILLYVGDHARPQIYRPGTGLQRAEPLAEIERKYDEMVRGGWEAMAQSLWTRNHEDSRTVCSHAFFRTCQPTCRWGLRERTYHVLAGSVLSVWDQLEFQRMQVVRVRSTNAGRVVGTLIPASCVDAIEKSLKVDAVSVETKTY